MIYEEVVEIRHSNLDGLREIKGYSAAFCECDNTLYIKTPDEIAWHYMICPVCGKEIALYCGNKKRYEL